MLRITSQFVRRRNRGIDPVYEETQCEDCGASAHRFNEPFENCEYCGEPHCPNCINYHEYRHRIEMEG